MKRFAFVPILLLVLASTLSAQEQVPFFNKKYDSKADPVADLKQAVAEAQKSHKNILLDVGGEWCSWCHKLDSLFRNNADLTEYLLKNFVPLKINMSPQNENKSFLSGFPEIEGYPHLFVLDQNGKLMHSQETGALEEGKHHSPEKVMAFLKRWTPPRSE